ncbi:MAG TPA: hypothetical protein VMB46_01365, partial [Methanomassiliicoccales archaeon]|nr:hypothetical protein [Methanomassiliicoccales archaeon]
MALGRRGTSLKKLAAVCVLLLFAVPMLAMLPANAAVTPTDSSLDKASLHAPGESVTSADGVQLHYASSDELAGMQNAIGTRVDGTDYNVQIDGHGTGLAPPSEEQWQQMAGSLLVLDPLSDAPAANPPSYDISAQPYFPAVGNQGGQGSCAAWAATYYCYGYLEAKDNGWSDAHNGTNKAHLMSPAWTYNRVNGGSDSGSWMGENVEVISSWGVPSLQTMPYSDIDYLGWGSAAAMREAPLHRALDYVTIAYTGDPTINSIKTLVASNKPVTYAFYAGGFSAMGSDYILSSAEYASYVSKTPNHAQTIVGYNDSISEGGDVGAFKVVNSWGTSDGYTNHGYYWVTYSALKSMGSNAEFTYVEDRVSYTPSLLAVWHYNIQPSRDADFSIGIGSASSPVMELDPFFAHDSNTADRLPAFICYDVTDLASSYLSGTNSFFLRCQNAGVDGVVSSFRIERYQSSYSPGAPTQASAQSPDIPKTTPCVVTLNFPQYAAVSYNQALDTSGLSFTSSSVADWVSVPYQPRYGSDAIKSGDTANSGESSLSTTLVGPVTIAFYWRVSSETGKDTLSSFLDSTKLSTISGTVNWTNQVVSVPSGTHVLKWTYAKDGSGSVGDDAGYVDMLRVLPTDDGYEPNNVQTAAKPIAPGNYSLVCNDDDWFKVAASPEFTLTATITFDPSLGNLDLFLYGTDGVTLLDASQTTGGVEEVVYPIIEAGNYYLLVHGRSGDVNTYNLSIELQTNSFDLGSVGSVRIQSGSGSFASLTSSIKSIDVPTNAHLTGNVLLSSFNYWPGSSTVPLVGLSSWGAHSSSFWSVSGGLSNGSTSSSASVDLIAPSTVGTYAVVFAFRNETSGAYVASATSTLVGSPAWDDGNDLASMTSQQLSDAQMSGRTQVQWLMVDGFDQVWLPCDAIIITTYVPDNDPPFTTASLSGSSGQNGWYESSVLVTLSAIDNVSGVQSTMYSIDGGGWSSYSGPFSVTSDGSHTVRFYSVDNRDNQETTRVKWVGIDRVAPSTLLSLVGSAGNDSWFTSTVVCTLNASDSVSGVSATSYRVDGSSWAFYTAPFSISAEGSHMVEWQSIDRAGNLEELNVREFGIDATAPICRIALEGSGSGDWFNSSVQATLSGDDAISGIAGMVYRIDSGLWTNYTGPVTVSGDGAHNIEAYSVDNAGLVSTHRNSTFSIDTTAPVASIEASGTQGEGGWYASAVNCSLNATDAESGVASMFMSVDGGPWLSGGSIAVDAQGMHAVRGYAVDRAGNPSSICEVEFGIDSLAPTSSVILNGVLGNDSWYVSNVTAVLSATDGASGVRSIESSLDGGEWSASTTVLVSGDGEHVLRYRASDLAGNVEDVGLLEVRIDTVAPTASITEQGTLGSNGWWTTNVTLQISGSDSTSGVAGVSYKLDSSDWTNCSGSLVLGLEGNHTLMCAVYDVAGNEGTLLSRVYHVDRSPPITTCSLSGELGSDNWYRGNVEVDRSAADAISGVARTESQLDG